MTLPEISVIRVKVSTCTSPESVTRVAKLQTLKSLFVEGAACKQDAALLDRMTVEDCVTGEPLL